MLSEISWTQKTNIACFLSYLETNLKKNDTKVEGGLFGKRKRLSRGRRRVKGL
jgi:hypothetical protein